MEKLKTKLDIKRMESDIIKQIKPEIEQMIKIEVVKIVADALEEQFYPPEKMIKKEFIKEVEETSKSVKEGKSELLTFEELQEEWKKEHES